MSSEPQKLHPAAIGVLALGALRDAALPIIVLLFTAVAGSGLDARRAASAARPTSCSASRPPR